MKLTVKKSILSDALQKLTTIVGQRSTLPVLANVLVEAENNVLKLTTTDLEIRITTDVEATIEKDGKTTLPAKRLQSIINKFIGDSITIETNEKHYSQIQCGTASFTLIGLVEDDFPLPVEFTPVKILKFSEAEIAKILDQISYGVSMDESRKVLHGILLAVKENTFTAVATDGKRLALVEKILEDFDGEDGNSILPIKSANELKHLLSKGRGDVNIEIGENQAKFTTGSAVMTTKLIEGSYPNYRQVIPNSFTKKVDVLTDSFLSALELVSIAISDTSAYIKLRFEQNKLYFEATSNDIGQGSDCMDIEYSDPEMTISFNPVFLAEPFRHVGTDSVTLKMNDGYSPVAIESGEGFLYVIMPMRNK